MSAAAAAVAACLALTASDASAALPTCPGVGAKQSLVREPGQLESAAFDAEGHLLYTNQSRRQVRALDAPGAATRTVAVGIDSPGGLVLEPGGTMLVGQGNSVGGLLAPATGLARLIRFDPETGEKTTYARGLSMTNGVVRAADGTVYASDDFVGSLDRVSPEGRVQRGWYRATDTNGLALSADGKTLFANRSFGATRVMAIDTVTGAHRVHWKPPASQSWVLLDDLDIDAAGNLYANAYLAGEVWRIAPGGSACALARGLLTAAGITLGSSGAGFSPTSAFVTTHTGSVVEIPRAVPAGRSVAAGLPPSVAG
ncbi:MAG: SMP-30/gluconolactonase/LRE family protein [Solirubrobacteraceae bacterium]|nr:SMP-30/gluconolactonase/LRE family protein [Solirubrobacteraceae bacterium]